MYNQSAKAYDKALKIYNDLLEINPPNLTALYGRGNVLFKLNRYHESDKVYTQALKLRKQAVFRQIEGKNSVEIMSGSNTSAYWIQVGNSHYNKWNDELALKCYEKAIEMDPQSSLAWNGRGKVFQRMGIVRESIDNYDHAIKINPLYADAWRNRGAALAELGKDDNALESYRMAKEIDPFTEVPYWLEHQRTMEISYPTENDDLRTLIIFVFIYLVITLIYISILKIKKIPKKDLIFNWIQNQKHFLLRNFYIPLRTFKFLEFLLLLTILSIPLISLGIYIDILESIYISIFLVLIEMSILAVILIINIFFWLIFSPSFIPCGYRAIWAEFEQQSKKRSLFNGLNYTAIAYFLISGIIAAASSLINGSEYVVLYIRLFADLCG
jgi:tetratricopeptide (TPR) repeat protein